MEMWQLKLGGLDPDKKSISAYNFRKQNTKVIVLIPT
jgi:hypothetical protein